jgi:hypothetical protein
MDFCLPVGAPLGTLFPIYYSLSQRHRNPPMRPLHYVPVRAVSAMACLLGLAVARDSLRRHAGLLLVGQEFAPGVSVEDMILNDAGCGKPGPALRPAELAWETTPGGQSKKIRKKWKHFGLDDTSCLGTGCALPVAIRDRTPGSMPRPASRARIPARAACPTNPGLTQPGSKIEQRNAAGAVPTAPEPQAATPVVIGSR